MVLPGWGRCVCWTGGDSEFFLVNFIINTDCWWFRNPKQPPEMYKTLQIMVVKLTRAKKSIPRKKRCEFQTVRILQTVNPSWPPWFMAHGSWLGFAGLPLLVGGAEAIRRDGNKPSRRKGWQHPTKNFPTNPTVEAEEISETKKNPENCFLLFVKFLLLYRAWHISKIRWEKNMESRHT